MNQGEEKLKVLLGGKRKILLMGFGKEGKSTYACLRKILGEIPVVITDANPASVDQKLLIQDENLSFIPLDITHYTYSEIDCIIKSPGISLKDNPRLLHDERLTSQTDIFLTLFHNQIIAVTGTKGKSTTAHSIFHLLNYCDQNCLMAGNMGLPLLDLLSKINSSTWIVCELSSHQLETIHKGPKIGVLLNIFEEHLDHYSSYQDYQNSKLNLCRYQIPSDYLIYDADQDLLIQGLMELKVSRKFIAYPMYTNSDGVFFDNSFVFSVLRGRREDLMRIEDIPLLGAHNLKNMIAALNVAFILNLNMQKAAQGLKSFKGLPHRLEWVGKVQGVKFYNDSISTIPQATIEALKSINDVDTLILGGFDRGISYQVLADYLKNNKVPHLVFVGEAGRRMRNLFVDQGVEFEHELVSDHYPQIVDWCKKHSTYGKSCVLSPAASSYDQFKNFEERGETFKRCVLHEHKFKNLA